MDPSDQTWHGQVRQRQGGGGANGVLPQRADQRLFLRVSQQTHPRQTRPGWPCGLSPPQTHDWMHPRLPVWPRACADRALAPARDARQVATRPLTLEGAPHRAMDGPERRRHRPQEATAQQAPSSGKTQAHTDQHILLVHARTSTVGYLGPTAPGKPHDKQATAQAPIASPSHAPLAKDTGCQGSEPARLRTMPPQNSHAARP